MESWWYHTVMVVWPFGLTCNVWICVVLRVCPSARSIHGNNRDSQRSKLIPERCLLWQNTSDFFYNFQSAAYLTRLTTYKFPTTAVSSLFSFSLRLRLFILFLSCNLSWTLQFWWPWPMHHTPLVCKCVHTHTNTYTYMHICTRKCGAHICWRFCSLDLFGNCDGETVVPK